MSCAWLGRGPVDAGSLVEDRRRDRDRQRQAGVEREVLHEAVEPGLRVVLGFLRRADDAEGHAHLLERRRPRFERPSREGVIERAHALLDVLAPAVRVR